MVIKKEMCAKYMPTDRTKADKFLKSIGENIRRIRILKGYKNMENFANLAMMNKDYYGAIERGQQNFTIQRLINIAETLGVPLEEFFIPNPEEVTIKFRIAADNIDEFRKLLGRLEYILQIKKQR